MFGRRSNAPSFVARAVLAAMLLAVLSSSVTTVSAGRLAYLQESDVNSDYWARHHRPQPRLACRGPRSESGVTDAAAAFDDKSTIVAGPTTFNQRRRGWVWVRDNPMADNSAKSKTVVPEEAICHKK